MFTNSQRPSAIEPAAAPASFRLGLVAGRGVAGAGGDGGPAVLAQVDEPAGVAGIITTIAGGGTETPADGALATAARLLAPTSLAFDRAGGLIVGEELGHRVWRLTPAGTVPPPPGS